LELGAEETALVDESGSQNSELFCKSAKCCIL